MAESGPIITMNVGDGKRVPVVVEEAQVMEKVYANPLFSMWDKMTLTFVGSRLYFPDELKAHRVVMPPSTTPAGEEPAEAFRAAMPKEVASAFRFPATLLNEGSLEGYGVPISTGIVFLLGEAILFHHPYTAISEVRTAGPAHLRYAFIPPAPRQSVFISLKVADSEGIASDIIGRAQAFSSLNTGGRPENIAVFEEFHPKMYNNGVPPVTSVQVIERTPQRIMMDNRPHPPLEHPYRPKILSFGRSVAVLSVMLIIGGVMDLIFYAVRDIPVVESIGPQFSYIGWLLGALEIIAGGIGMVVLLGQFALPGAVVWSILVLAVTILALALWGSFYAFAATMGFVLTAFGGIHLVINALCHLACVVQGGVFIWYASKDNPRRWTESYRPLRR